MLVVIEKSDAITAGMTTIVKLFVTIWLPINNPTVNVYVPAVVGVPEILPVPDKLNPSGRDPLSMYHVRLPRLDDASVVMSKL